MRKTKPRKPEQQMAQEEFQAYGEYSYAFLHKKEEQAEPQSVVQPEPAPIPIPKAKGRKKRSKTGVFFKLLAVLTALTITLIVVQETVFRLQTVYVIGNTTKTAQEVVMASGLVRGINIFSVHEEDIAKAMSKNYTIVFKGMQIEYPSTIYLYIEERSAVAVLQWLGNQYELDQEGLVMSQSSTMSPPASMPIVTGFRITNAHVGQKLSVHSTKQIEAYQEIMSELTLQLFADQVSEINLSDSENIYLILNDGITIRLGDGSYMRAKIGAVRTDMAYLRQLGKNSGMLDVSIPEDAKFMPQD
ncbi:MAG: cell division protein FtsQ/DivIB [Eubacteriales bacterium]|nr:cell division protein FtsQ/DivIB [Eubacteriales bacterium]